MLKYDKYDSCICLHSNSFIERSHETLVKQQINHWRQNRGARMSSSLLASRSWTEPFLDLAGYTLVARGHVVEKPKVITGISGQNSSNERGTYVTWPKKKGQLNSISLSDAMFNTSHIMILHMIYIQMHKFHVKQHPRHHNTTWTPSDLQVIEVTFLFGWPSVSCGSVLLGPTWATRRTQMDGRFGSNHVPFRFGFIFRWTIW